MEKINSLGGYLFDIQGFSVHDGPGCRTLIFFKGCPLRCSWCSNPEGINPLPEILFNKDKCIFDNLCVAVCKKKAITLKNKKLSINNVICKNCTDYVCVDECCTSALRKAGYYITIDELFKKIKRDQQYWGAEGGITLTGGEPFMQPKFAHELLKKCYHSYIHTAIETCGYAKWEHYEKSLPFIEWIFFDIKHMDTLMHKKMTGVDNKLILKNAKLLAENFNKRLIFRMPLIPDFNDSLTHIKQLAKFIKSIEKNEINILPIHHLGREKYNLLGQKYSLSPKQIVKQKTIGLIQEVFDREKIICYIGDKTPF